MDGNEQQQAAVKSYILAYNAFDLEGMLVHLHDEVVFRNISNGEVNLETRGKIAFAEQARLAAGYFTERKQTIADIQFPESQVIEVAIDYQAVLAIDFPNGMKQGDKIAIKGRSCFRFENDQIVEIEDVS
ncbi:MAG: nuclear transport factor 2 family protein [Saprospiraceae bacterium]|nr:nuclear transport factor 2 family protein [Saprospiraceae bacterium]